MHKISNPFITLNINANCKMTGYPRIHVRVSLASPQTKRLCATERDAIDMQNTDPAAIGKLTASRSKGAGTPKAIKKLPKGGPKKAPMIYSMLHNWPLAPSEAAEGTIDGNTVWAALSRSTSATPSRKANPDTMTIAAKVASGGASCGSITAQFKSPKVSIMLKISTPTIRFWR
jgi:hypothetical protein